MVRQEPREKLTDTKKGRPERKREHQDDAH
jgi:hypothetical protein